MSWPYLLNRTSYRTVIAKFEIHPKTTPESKVRYNLRGTGVESRQFTVDLSWNDHKASRSIYKMTSKVKFKIWPQVKVGWLFKVMLYYFPQISFTLIRLYVSSDYPRPVGLHRQTVRYDQDINRSAFTTGIRSDLCDAYFGSNCTWIDARALHGVGNPYGYRYGVGFGWVWIFFRESFGMGWVMG